MRVSVGHIVLIQTPCYMIRTLCQSPCATEMTTELTRSVKSQQNSEDSLLFLQSGVAMFQMKLHPKTRRKGISQQIGI